MLLRTLILALLFLLLGVLPAQSNDYLWCFDADEIVLEVDPQSGLLTATQRAAMYNCCPEPVDWDIDHDPGVLTIIETVGVEAPCDCICCFDFKVEVEGLSPGVWFVNYYWLNEEDLLWHLHTEEVTIPGDWEPASPEVAAWDKSDCLSVAAVPDQDPDVAEWSALKAWYR
jgi:hypothetical protein